MWVESVPSSPAQGGPSPVWQATHPIWILFEVESHIGLTSLSAPRRNRIIHAGLRWLLQVLPKELLLKINWKTLMAKFIAARV